MLFSVIPSYNSGIPATDNSNDRLLLALAHIMTGSHGCYLDYNFLSLNWTKIVSFVYFL